MPPKNKFPKMKGSTKTLTQRRVGPGDSSEPPRYSGLSQPSNLSSFTPQGQGQSAEKGQEGGGSVIKIVIWAVVILATGIGLALVVRNLTKDNDTNKAEEEQAEDTTTEDEDNADTTDDTAEEEIDDTDTTGTGEEETDSTDIIEDTTKDTTEATAGDTLTNEYSQTAQTISDGMTGNLATLTGYRYQTFSANFVYTIKLGSVTQFPGATASLNATAKTLTVIVSNVKTDQIVGNGGTATTTFAGSGNANTVDISNSAGKTTFVFHLDKATNYKINAVEGTEFDSITVDIKNS